MKTRTIIFAAFCVLFLGFILCGCVTQKKATSYFDNHAFQGADYCASRFPVDSFFKPGKIITTTDTITIPGQTIYLQDTITNIIKDSVKCPPSKIIKISNSKVDTAGIIDKAKYKALQGKIIELQTKITYQATQVGKTSADAERWKNGRNSWRWIGISALSVIAASLITFLVVKFKII